MMITIVFFRALSVTLIKNAIATQSKTPRKMVTEVLGAGLIFALLFGAPRFYLLSITRITMVIFISALMYGASVASVSIFTLIKVRTQIRSISSISPAFGSHLYDDFQKLVTSVAFVFCCSQIASAIVICLIEKQLENEENTLFLIILFGGNCSGPFIYLSRTYSYMNYCMDDEA